MRKSIPIILVLLLTVSSVAYADLTDGLVAYYPFDGDANDYSGYGNNAIYVGAALTTDRFGNPDNVYSFEGGTGNYIEILNSSSININIFTLSCWVSFYDLANSYTILDKRNGQWYRNYSFNYYADDSELTGSPLDYLTIVIGDGTFAPSNYSNAAYSPVNLSENHFYFIAATYDQNFLKLYLNGELVGTRAISMSGITGNGNLFIGRHGGDTQLLFYGAIDDMRIYNRALSASEINQLYNLDVYNQASTFCFCSSIFKYLFLPSVKKLRRLK